MKATMTANIRMVQKYESDTVKGINVFCEEENEGLNPNLIGPIQLVIGGTVDQYPLFQAYANSGLLPGEFEITVDVGRGSGGKAKLTLLSIKDPALKKHLSQTDNQTAVETAGKTIFPEPKPIGSLK
ncbi:MAG: hypothetical protein EPN89_04580 [Methylovulum sp.]|nr:MAG: hypothetical protein EPN89_04580 [Methylovulum sp.]